MQKVCFAGRPKPQFTPAMRAKIVMEVMIILLENQGLLIRKKKESPLLPTLITSSTSMAT